MIYKFDTIISYNKIALSVVCCSPLLIVIFISIIEKELSFFPISIVSIFCVMFFGVSHIILKSLYDEFISYNNNCIVYRGSKIDGGKEKEIPTKDLKEILWENESFTSGPGSRNSIYLIYENSEKQVIVKDKIAGLLSIQKTTLNKFSSIMNVPVKKEYYSLSSNLKQRRKINSA